MVEFGDEFIIDSYRIPWLVWIQILIMFLLLLLLYSFSLFGNDSNSNSNNLDPCSSSSSSSSSSSCVPSSSDTQKQNPRKQDTTTTTTTSVAGCSLEIEIDQVVENQGKKKGGTSRIRVRGEENIAMEASTSALKDPAYIDYHPCHIVRLASIAFLKCLGLDPKTENSSERRKNR